MGSLGIRPSGQDQEHRHPQPGARQGGLRAKPEAAQLVQAIGELYLAALSADIPRRLTELTQQRGLDEAVAAEAWEIIATALRDVTAELVERFATAA